MFPQNDSQLQGTESCNGFIETDFIIIIQDHWWKNNFC